ncbi:MAG: DUF3788 family protein [Myxococcaceae bacterium]|nr:DUF3788 family protein [Myxococcaceae bacterium]MBH2006759.1 DUF3788 family protein [Myxococcaceae bacterium]
MAKSPLKDKDFIPTDESLAQILGNRWNRYQETVAELTKRKLYPEMYWYGPSSGWAPRFCIAEVTVCGIYLAQNPLMGLVGVGDKVGMFLDKDQDLSPRARGLYEMTPKKGPLRWIEAQLATRGDLEAFLSLVDGKLRALATDGTVPKDTPPLPGRIKRKEPGPVKEPGKPGRKAAKASEPKEEPIQIGPPENYSIQDILRAGRG